MSRMVTVLVTNEEALQKHVLTLLEKELSLGMNDIALDCFPDLESLKQAIDGGLHPACLILHLPENDPAYMKAVGKLKKNASLRFTPFIGLYPDQKIKAYSTRRHFFHVLDQDHYEGSLPHTVESALSDFTRYQELLGEVQKRTSAIGLIQNGDFSLKTLEEAEALTVMLSNACPDPPSVALGLTELLVNAIEHGNLCITFEEKTRLLERGQWENEVARRICSAEYGDKSVFITFERSTDNIKIVIRDEGSGFDWRKFLNQSSDDLEKAHGRGISLACALAFSDVSYNEKGNQVTVTISL